MNCNAKINLGLFFAKAVIITAIIAFVLEYATIKARYLLDRFDTNHFTAINSDKLLFIINTRDGSVYRYYRNMEINKQTGQYEKTDEGITKLN